MCEAVLSVERGRMHVGLLTVGVPYMHRMEPPIPKHLAEAPAELLTALTALTVPGALVASLPDDACLSLGGGGIGEQPSRRTCSECEKRKARRRASSVAIQGNRMSPQALH